MDYLSSNNYAFPNQDPLLAGASADGTADSRRDKNDTHRIKTIQEFLRAKQAASGGAIGCGNALPVVTVEGMLAFMCHLFPLSRKHCKRAANEDDDDNDNDDERASRDSDDSVSDNDGDRTDMDTMTNDSEDGDSYTAP